jgi:hypothetical protein
VVEQTISIIEAIRLLNEMRVQTPKGIRNIARRIALDVIRESTKNVSNDLLMVRSGTLRRYITATLKAQLTDDATGVHTGLPKGDTEAKIARVQDEGATIRPKGHPFLRVPIPGGPALTGAGVDRIPFPPTIRGRFAPNGRPFFIPRGMNIIATTMGRGQKQIQAWYALVPQVVLKPRYWWTGAVKAVEMRVPQHIEKVMRRIVQSQKPEEPTP